jgi:hypothetical protein
MTQRLRDVLLRHLRGHAEVDANLPVRQIMGEAQNYRSAAFGTELLQHYPEPRGPLCSIQIRVECRQGLELLLRRGLIDVDVARLPMFEYRVLLHEIVRDRVEVEDRIADPFMVGDSQHPHVYLLRQVRGVGLAPDTPPEERLQRGPMLGKKPCYQGWFRVNNVHRDTSLGAPPL